MIYHLLVFQKAKSSRCKKIFALFALILHCSFELTTLKAAAIEIYRPQFQRIEIPNSFEHQLNYPEQKIINSNRQEPKIIKTIYFQYSENYKATEIINPTFNAFVFDEVKKLCFKSDQNYTQEFQRIFKAENNPILKGLINTYGKSIENKLTDVQILIDDFSTFQKDYFKNYQPRSSGKSSDKQLEFRSFFIPAQQNIKNTISLDCHPTTMAVWSSLLSHELTHFLNQQQNLAYWMDELLAQVHESEQIKFPHSLIFDVLKSESNLPSFFSDKSYFQNSNSSKVYTMNLLFGLYLTSLFKGGSLLKYIHKDIQTLSDLVEKIKLYAIQINQYEDFKSILSAKGLIRHFALAANINLPLNDSRLIFQIPKWNGFSKSALVTTNSSQSSYLIPPGGFLRISKSIISDQEFANFTETINSNLEIYRIQKNQIYFQIITPQNQSSIENTRSTTWDEDFYLLINTSETETFTFTI